MSRKRPLRSVFVVRSATCSVTSANGWPFRRKTWPESAVTPGGAVSGGNTCQGEYGLPSRVSPRHSQSSRWPADRAAWGRTGWRWWPPWRPKGPVPVPVCLSVAGAAVLNVNEASGMGMPSASRVCDTVTRYSVPESRSSAGCRNARRPSSPRCLGRFAPAGPTSLTLADDTDDGFTGLVNRSATVMSGVTSSSLFAGLESASRATAFGPAEPERGVTI